MEKFLAKRSIYRNKLYRILSLWFLLGSGKALSSSVFHSQFPEFSTKFKDYYSENIIESQNGEKGEDFNYKSANNYNRSNQDILGISSLVSEAELVHSKLSKILSDYYFRIYRVNLDSKCLSKKRTDSCSSEKNFINLSKKGLNTQNSLFDNQNGSYCVQVNGNGNGSSSQSSNGNGKENGANIPKCHVDRCNSSDIPFNIMGSKKENYVLRFSESSLNQKMIDKFGFSPKYFESSPLVSENYVFVDLLRNPPSYTGYNGSDDWKLIQSEMDKYENMSCKNNHHMYKLISGMQTSISAFSSLNYECTNPVEAYENQTELPKYQSNYHFYLNKLSKNRDWIENLYYTYSYVLSAVVRLRGYLNYYSSNLQLVNNELYLNLKEFVLFADKYSTTTRCDCNFNRPKKGEKEVDQEDDDEQVDPYCCNMNLVEPDCGLEIMKKFGSLIQLVNCVNCEKCRLHGILKLSSIRTAIKILTCPNEKMNELDLDRNELVSLLHGLDYFAQSVLIIDKFEHHKKRQMMLYPLRFLLATLLLLIVIYRREIFTLTSKMSKSNQRPVN